MKKQVNLCVTLRYHGVFGEFSLRRGLSGKGKILKSIDYICGNSQSRYAASAWIEQEAVKLGAVKLICISDYGSDVVVDLVVS